MPDISKWNISKVDNLYGMFYNCFSLTIIPNIGKWDIASVKNINYLFWGCRSLYKAPDISKWQAKDIIKMEGVFGECISLSYLPDISNWEFGLCNKFYYNMINYVEKYENPMEIIIKKCKIGEAEVQKIYDSLEGEYYLSNYRTEDEVKYHIAKYEGNMDLIFNYIEIIVFS